MKTVACVLAVSLVSAGVFAGMPLGRIVTDLSGSGWTFDGEAVSVPHTWNAKDGADGEGVPTSDESVSVATYARRCGIYRRALPCPRDGKRYFIRCHGASQKATVRVNGEEIGRHVGAFTAFCFEATRMLRPCGNLLEIEVDNIVDRDVPPVRGDWTMFGGLYRKVELIETDRICIDCVTDGANGIVIDADPDTGDVVAYVSVDGGTNEVQRFSFPNPELWSPENPKLYTLDITMKQDGCMDSVRETFGFRKAEFRDDGFYLNGQKRKIRGVNMHQDMEGIGWALPEERYVKDIALVKEMGADGLRTAHYPHSWRTYDECDKVGLLVWCELPATDTMTPTETFRANAFMGLREMIAQLRNHPSIVTWSISNEYRTNAVVSHVWLKRCMTDLKAEAKRLDPSRAVSAATYKLTLPEINAIPGVLGWNCYPGWNNRRTMEDCLDGIKKVSERRTFSISEYGAGGNVDCHDSAEVPVVVKSPFHHEEYQAWVHHAQYKVLQADPRIWGTFAWLMFDFAADIRREGSRFGLNDKGLVARDHTTKKDAFYFYKANWNPSPMLHLVGTRMTDTTNGVVTVMGFSNVGDVTFSLNGTVFGTKRPDRVNTVIWRNVPLVPGRNRVRLDAAGIACEAVWNRVSDSLAVTP